jgi:hypothetical protein
MRTYALTFLLMATALAGALIFARLATAGPNIQTVPTPNLYWTNRAYVPATNALRSDPGTNYILDENHNNIFTP